MIHGGRTAAETAAIPSVGRTTLQRYLSTRSAPDGAAIGVDVSTTRFTAGLGRGVNVPADLVADRGAQRPGRGRAGTEVRRAVLPLVPRGTPRAINNLAIQALVAAFATGKAIVDESSARAAVTEVTAE